MANSITGSSALDSISASRLESSTKSTSLDQDAFLELMIAQLKNQSPTKPMESGEFLSQMAEFGTVSGIQDLQSSFESLASSLQSNQALQASTMVGRQVLIDSSSLTLESGQNAALSFEVPATASKVQITIKDSSGQAVRTLSLGATAAGTQSVVWDGLNSQGSTLPSGDYTVSANAVIDGESQALTTMVVANVESVTLPRDGSSPVLNVTDHGAVSLSAVRRVL